jgi:putative phage-type endonuclease
MPPFYGVINVEQRSEEWFLARKNKVTGSMVGAILGCNPWMKPADAMRSMVRAHHGAESEFTGNVATEYGVTNENNALRDYEMISGHDVSEVGFFVHPEFDWLGASPDGAIDGTGNLEIKCPFGKRNDIEPVFKTLAEQPHYYAQVQIEMACSGMLWSHFYQWNAYGDAMEYIEKDHDWLDENIPVLHNFYLEFMQECKTPDKHLAPLIKSVSADKLAARYNDAKQLLELAKQSVEDIKQELITMADGNKSNISGLLVTPITKKGSVSYSKAVKDLLPGVDLTPYMGKEISYWMVK